ncbi:hypothetical protein D0T84_22650 [Dysgonomonas sp. 521]|nr:hypothetical protein [Dysgonomonas sp. 521]
MDICRNGRFLEPISNGFRTGLLGGDAPDYAEKINQYQNYYKNMIVQKNISKEQLYLNKNQYQRDSLLYKRGVISSEDLEISRNQYLQDSLSLENIHSSIQNTEIQVTQMQENLLDTEFQYQDKKNQLETQIKTYISQLLSEIQTWELD